MLKRFVALGLVGLFVVMSFVVAEDSIGPYNPIADVNKDGVVDILDMVEVGQAYGSTSLISIPNQTVITVFNETSPIKNARVAIFSGGSTPDKIGYTDASGIANFTLNPNTNYTTVVWSGAAYNYASFTSNSFGEASESITLESTTKHLPAQWVVVSIVNQSTGELVAIGETIATKLTRVEVPEGEFRFIGTWSDSIALLTNVNGISIGMTLYGYSEPNSSWGFTVWNPYEIVAFAACSLDENGTANVVIPVE